MYIIIPRTSISSTQDRLGATYENGRLHSYFTIMEVVLTVCAHPVILASTIDAKALPRSTKGRTMCVDAPLSLYGEKEWNRIIKALKNGKNALLRKDANQQILTLSFLHCLDPKRGDGEEDDPSNYDFKPINSSGSAQMKLTPAIIEAIESHHDDVVNRLIDVDPDEQRKDLDLFEVGYNKILDQLELHKTLGGLKATLTGIVEGDIEAVGDEAAALPRTRSGASPAKPKPPTKTELAKKKRQVQSRIDGYLDSITKLLSSPTAETAEGDAINAAAFAAVRKLIKEFSSYLTNGLEHVAEKWAEKCLVLLGEVEVGLLTKLRTELESLLRGWCSAVLDLPALVKCGYATKPLEERSVPVTAPSEDVEMEDAAGDNDKIMEQDEEEMDAGNVDDDSDMPVADEDDDDHDDDATVPKPMFDGVDNDVEVGVHIGDDEDAEEEEESDIDESQPLLTQAPPGFDHNEASSSSSSDEEEEETKGTKDDVQVTPSRLTRRAADFQNKSLSNVITESAVAAVAAEPSSSKKPAASADSGRKAPATAPRRRKGRSAKTPVRRSPPPRGVQNDSDLDYKGSPERRSTHPRATKEDSSSASDSSDDDNDKKAKAAAPAGKKHPRLRYDDRSDEESTDEDVASRQRKKSRKTTTATSVSSSVAKKTPRGETGATSKSPKRTPRLTGTKLCTSSSSSEYEDTSAGNDNSSSSDDEDIPSPAAKSKAVSSPVPRIQPQSTRGVNVPRSGGKKRKRWTDEEKEAVRQGIAQHGVGRWALIKSDWAMELRDRTSVQIKDCYRTMLKRGELSEYDSDSD